jgi:hypothetical protein
LPAGAGRELQIDQKLKLAASSQELAARTGAE